jgi:hypothetical protein
MRAFSSRFAFGGFPQKWTAISTSLRCGRTVAPSIFGAASHPVVRNGELLCFATEERAQAECDRLNAGSGGFYVHYTVKPAYVQPAPANGLASPENGLALLSEAFRRASQRASDEQNFAYSRDSSVSEHCSSNEPVPSL